jgi:hypothetical protein
MLRKLPTLRSVMITTTALITGLAVDAIAQSTASYLGSHQQGIGELIIAITASWVLDKLSSILRGTNELIISADSSDQVEDFRSRRRRTPPPSRRPGCLWQPPERRDLT